jgi:hypothetical protein
MLAESAPGLSAPRTRPGRRGGTPSSSAAGRRCCSSSGAAARTCCGSAGAPRVSPPPRGVVRTPHTTHVCVTLISHLTWPGLAHPGHHSRGDGSADATASVRRGGAGGSVCVVWQSVDRCIFGDWLAVCVRARGGCMQRGTNPSARSSRVLTPPTRRSRRSSGRCRRTDGRCRSEAHGHPLDSVCIY